MEEGTFSRGLKDGQERSRQERRRVSPGRGAPREKGVQGAGRVEKGLRVECVSRARVRQSETGSWVGVELVGPVAP